MKLEQRGVRDTRVVMRQGRKWKCKAQARHSTHATLGVTSATRDRGVANVTEGKRTRAGFLFVRKGGEGGEKPIMGRPCARAHGCVRLSRTKNLLNNLYLLCRKPMALTPSSKRDHYDMEMSSAPDCLMGAF
ncbi:hypothetical protein EVAR_34491_1 [Eumeta japonica]|uniref:Uncharacterized protein n=1 Tax=Eumeta variegata TaxID=151549 RepID=A0A4C1WU06_EUMVA|nr:hypothetical protein EVAR_34491_1 [Eumeta japonica]